MEDFSILNVMVNKLTTRLSKANGDVSSSDCNEAPNVGCSTKNKLEKLWWEVAVAYFRLF
jgi:hypothetical protein